MCVLLINVSTGDTFWQDAEKRPRNIVKLRGLLSADPGVKVSPRKRPSEVRNCSMIKKAHTSLEDSGVYVPQILKI